MWFAAAETLTNGEEIYYKNNDCKKWYEPVFIIGHDEKLIIVCTGVV